MFRRIIIAGALTAAFTVPSLAAEWNVLKLSAGPSDAKEVCYVVDRVATPGETRVAGPFASQTEGLAASAKAPACENNDTNSGSAGSSGSGPN